MVQTITGKKGFIGSGRIMIVEAWEEPASAISSTLADDILVTDTTIDVTTAASMSALVTPDAPGTLTFNNKCALIEVNDKERMVAVQVTSGASDVYNVRRGVGISEYNYNSGLTTFIAAATTGDDVVVRTSGYNFNYNPAVMLIPNEGIEITREGDPLEVKNDGGVINVFEGEQMVSASFNIVETAHPDKYKSIPGFNTPQPINVATNTNVQDIGIIKSQIGKCIKQVMVAIIPVQGATCVEYRDGDNEIIHLNSLFFPRANMVIEELGSYTSDQYQKRITLKALEDQVGFGYTASEGIPFVYNS